MLTFEEAKELFTYEPETGMLIRKVATGNNRFHAGAAAGCSSPDGYLRVRVDKRRAKRYCAEIKVNRIRKFLGYFYTLDEATAARWEAELKYGFHSNHGLNKSIYVKKR